MLVLIYAGSKTRGYFPGLAPVQLTSLVQDLLTVIFFRWRRVNFGNLTSSTPRL
jgi:hypothetical protein